MVSRNAYYSKTHKNPSPPLHCFKCSKPGHVLCSIPEGLIRYVFFNLNLYLHMFSKDGAYQSKRFRVVSKHEIIKDILYYMKGEPQSIRWDRDAPSDISLPDNMQFSSYDSFHPFP